MESSAQGGRDSAIGGKSRNSDGIQGVWAWARLVLRSLGLRSSEEDAEWDRLEKVRHLCHHETKA